jgi:DNA-directed RNA polymerase specialized sigma24 family protein
MGSGRRATIRVEGKTIREISAETGIREETIRARIFRGCTIQDILSGRAPEAIVVDGVTLSELAATSGISKDTLYWRYRHGRKTIAELTAGLYDRLNKKETEK